MPKKSEVDQRLDRLFEGIQPVQSGPQAGDFSDFGEPLPSESVSQPEGEQPALKAAARSGWRIGLVIGVAVLVLLAAAGWQFWRGQDRPVSPAELIPEDSGPGPSLFSVGISEMEGVVSFRAPDSTQFTAVAPNQIIPLSSAIRTGAGSHTRLDLSNKSLVRLGENTLVIFQSEKKIANGNHYRLELMHGEVWVILRGGQVDVQTPSGLASVYGSFISVMYDPKTNATTVKCLEGHCNLRNESGKVDMVSGQSARVYDAAMAPDLGRMSNQDVTHWLVHNPEATLTFPDLQATYVALPSVTDGPSLTPPAEMPTRRPGGSSTPTVTGSPTVTETASVTLTITGTRFQIKTRTPTPSPTPTIIPISTDWPTEPSPQPAQQG